MNIANNAFRRAAALIVAAAAAVTAFAADVPGRVARLSEFAGEVQLANDYEGWRAIPRNYTVTSGDNIWVIENGRAEFDLGAAQLWFAGGSNAYIEHLDDEQLIARLSQGAMAIRIRTWEPRDITRILTPHGEIALVQPGLYFISTDNSYEPTVLSVKSGAAEISGRMQPQTINRGQTAQFDQNGLQSVRYGNVAVGSGGFEAWANARDRRFDRWNRRAGSAINPLMIGATELDDYGYWETTYEYGRVWYPTSVASGWAPYRYGRWSWVQPWGWTWVDDAAWGFAPFHYGRWVRVGPRWAWVPGSFSGRPVYAPALVTFFGGNGWSVSSSIGPTYSWVPLGWNEPYVPWYTYTPNYWRQVNRPYVRNVAEDPWRPRAYVHASVPGAITAVAGATMLAGRPIRDNYVRNISERDLMSAPPARMGEVVPQFRGPQVGQAVPGRGPANGNAGAVNRGGLPAPVVRERSAGAAVVAPNTNVLQPRVQDNPAAFNGRPQQAPGRPGEISPGQPAATVTENPGVRERAVPVAKDPRERNEQRNEPRYVQPPPRSNGNNSDYRGVAPAAPAAPVAEPRNAPPPMRAVEPQRPAPVAEPRVAPAPPRAVEGPRPVQAVPAPAPVAPPRVVERPAPAVVAPPPPAPVVAPPPAAVGERPRGAPAEPNRGRERDKDRVPVREPAQ